MIFDRFAIFLCMGDPGRRGNVCNTYFIDVA
jgi:hypothetical protein